MLLSYFLISEASKLNTVSLTGELELMKEEIDRMLFNFILVFCVVDRAIYGAHLPMSDIEFLEVLANVLEDS